MTNNQLYVNSAELIREIYDDYNIASDDFVSRVSTWIYNALDELNFIQAYVEKTIDINIEHYRGQLPDDFQGLINLTIEDRKIPLRSPHDNNLKTKFKELSVDDEIDIDFVNSEINYKKFQILCKQFLLLNT